jgi:hypothetical protein
MASQIKVPQSFVYMAKIPAVKKIKNIVFRHGDPVLVHDPKVVRLLSKLPYMKAAETVASDVVAPARVKAAPMSRDIPTDWRTQHHKRRVAWARQITGGEVTTATEANRIIAEHLGEAEAPVVAASETQAA